MNLQKVLNPAVVSLELAGTTKPEVIDELLALIVGTGKVADVDAARRALIERERKMSTGMQHGVAIPHGKTDAVESLHACVGIHRDGIDFESLDGEPSKIFVMTLSPLNRAGPHIQFLAEISRLLNSPERREAMIAATDAGELLEILTS